MKQLIEQNTDAINTDLQTVKDLKPLFQDIYNECKTIGVKFESTAFIEFLRTYYASNNTARLQVIEQYIKHQLFSQMEIPNFGGVPIDKNKLADIIQLPNIDNLKQLLDKVPPTVNYQDMKIGTSLNQWFILENEEIKEVPNLTETITEKHSIYITTQKQLDKYKLVKPLVDAANNILDNEPNLDRLMHPFIDIQSYKYLDYNNGRYKVNSLFIRDITD